MLLGFDPGRDKCGLAVLSPTGSLVWHQVVSAANVGTMMQGLRRDYDLTMVILGNQTTSAAWQQQLRAVWPDCPVQTIDERFSSQEARRRYWEFVAPQGLWRWVPAPWRPLPAACDDIAAVILVLRYLAQS